MNKRMLGFTMLELLIVVAILSTLLSFAVPSFKGVMEKSRLKGAGESVYSNLQLAKSEAIMRNRKINVSIKTGNNWCMGMSDKNTCDCAMDATDANACKVDGSLRVLKAADYPDISMTSNYTPTELSFEQVRGVASAANNIEFLAPNNNQYIRVVVSTLGIVRLCASPNDANPQGVAGYPGC